MCGIAAACKPNEDVVPFLVNAIKQMEYRGYDSWGLGLGPRLPTIKSVEKFEDAVFYCEPAEYGIAHTRWATQGKACLENAHPIESRNKFNTSCLVVHNGNITNYNELRELLETCGYEFRTETDTEVIAHLFAFYSNDTAHAGSIGFLEVLHDICRRLDGQFAFAVISTRFPDRVGAASFGAPLLYAEGYLASDARALSGFVEKAHRLENRDILVVSADEALLMNDRQVVSLDDREVVSMESQAKSSHRFVHEMLKEIHEQADLDLSGFTRHFPVPKRIVLFGCGSSYNAARLGRPYIEELTGIHCEVEYASDITYRTDVYDEDTLFVALTQSGETKDTLLAMEALHNEQILAITNDMTSSAASYADWVIPLGLSQEIGVAATKTFTMQVVRLIQLGLSLTPEWTSEELGYDLRQLNGEIAEVLQQGEAVRKAVELVKRYDHLIFLGRGRSYPVAMEAALKMKEVSYKHSEAIHAAEMKHGPLALIDENTLGILIDSFETYQQERVVINAKEIKARGGKLLVLTRADSELAKLGDFVIPVNSSLLTQPILANVALQLLAYFVAVDKGLNPDRPRSLAKCVTVE